MLSAARLAAATRRGRCQSSSIGHRSVALELFRPQRKQQRQHRVLQEAGIDEIGTSKPEVGQLHLKVGIVPESDGNGFVLRQAVADVHIRRKDRSLRIGGARRHAGAPNDVVWRGDWRRGMRIRWWRGAAELQTAVVARAGYPRRNDGTP